MNTSARNGRKKMGYLQISHRKHPIYQGVNTIGRDKEATVIIRDLRASHRHAVIVVVDKDQHFIADMKSANGTEIEGQNLRYFELYPIKDGSQITFASGIKGTYNMIIDENMSMSMMASQSTQVEDGFYAANTQLVEDNASFAVPLPPPPKDNVEFPDDDASFSAINTQVLIEQVTSKNLSSTKLEDLPTQVVSVPTQNDVSEIPTQVLDIHDMNTQILEHTNDIHDMVTQVIEEKSVEDQTGVINEDTTGQEITDAAPVVPEPSNEISEERVETKTDVDENGENTSKEQRTDPDPQPNDEEDTDRLSQLQTSLLTRRLRNVLPSDDDKSPESFVDSDPQSQLPKTKQKNSNVIRSDLENDDDKEENCSCDSEDFATVNVQWDDAEVAQASTRLSQSPKKKMEDSSSDNTDVEDNAPAKKVPPEKTAQQDLNGSTDCSDSDTDVEGNVKYNASFLETTTDSFVEKRRSLDVTNEIIPATQEVHDDDIIPSTQCNMSNSDSLVFSLRVECSEDEGGTKDPPAPSTSKADFDFAVPKTKQSTSKEDSFDFDCPTQKVTEESDFDFVAPTQQLLSDSFDFAAPTQQIATDFDAPTQKITGGSVNFEAATEKLNPSQDNFDFEVPTQKIDDNVALRTSTDVDFDAPTQKVTADTNVDKNDSYNFVRPTQVNDSFDFDAPTQKVNTTKENTPFKKPTGRSDDSFDFDAPTQKISATKVSAERKTTEQAGDASFDFDAPTQKISTTKEVKKPTGDVGFETDTLKLAESYIESNSDESDDPTQKAAPTKEVGHRKEDDFDFFAPTQQIVLPPNLKDTSITDVSKETKKNDPTQKIVPTQEIGVEQRKNDDFDFLAPTQQIVLPPNLKDTSETNLSNEAKETVCNDPTQKIAEIEVEQQKEDEFDFFALTQQIVLPPNLKSETNLSKEMEPVKKKVSFGHVENLEDSSKGVESQLEVIFATQAVVASPDPSRPANPIGEAFNNASTQDVLNCLASDSGRNKIAVKTRLSKLSTIKHDSDEEKDLTDVSDGENEVKVAEKLTVVDKPTEKVKSEEKSTKRSLRNTKRNVTPDREVEANEGSKRLRRSRRGSTEKEVAETSVPERQRRKKEPKSECLPNIEEDAELSDDGQSTSKAIPETRSRRTRKGSIEDSKSSESEIGLRTRSSAEKTVVSDIKEDADDGQSTSSVTSKTRSRRTRKGSIEDSKSAESEQSSRLRTRNSAEKTVVSDVEEDTDDGQSTSSSKATRSRRTRKNSVEGLKSSEPERGSRLRTRSSVERTVVSEVEPTKERLEDVAEENVEEVNQRRKRVPTRKTAKAGSAVVTAQSSSDTSTAIKRGHADNPTVPNVTSKKTKNESDDKIKITVPKKQINLEISDSEVAQQSFVADSTFNKVADRRLKRERVQADSDSSKRKRTVDESQLSTPERKKRNLKPKIVFTMLDSPELCQIIRSLGGFVVDTVDACTVLVTKNVLRSQKLLCAVAQAKPICSPDWLYACKKANVFLDPWEHLMKDKEAEKKWNFSLVQSFERSKQAKLFEGYSFQLIVNNAADVLKGAIESAGGKCVARAPKAGGKFLIIASEENKNKCSKFSKQGHKIALPEAVFDGVLRQELVFDKHLLIL